VFEGLLSSLLDQFNKLLAAAFIELLKFLQNVLAIPLYPRTGTWQNFFYENALNLTYYLAFVVLIGMTIVGMFNQNRRTDWGRAIISFVIIGAFGRVWFTICDNLQMVGNDLSKAAVDLVPEAHDGASLLSHITPPNPFIAALGLGMASALGWFIGITAFAFPIIFIFVKFTGLIFFGIRVVGNASQAAWDWAFGLLMVATVFGRPIMILCLDVGIACVKYMPGGTTSYGAVLYTIAAEGLALYATYKLIRNAPRISSKLTGGLARTVSEISGKVVTETKQALGVSVSGGIRAHANGMSTVADRVQPSYKRQAAILASHNAKARTAQAVTTAGAVAFKAAGMPAAAPVVKSAGGLFEQRLKKKTQQKLAA
jgi:hypothetical protein